MTLCSTFLVFLTWIMNIESTLHYGWSAFSTLGRHGLDEEDHLELCERKQATQKLSRSERYFPNPSV